MIKRYPIPPRSKIIHEGVFGVKELPDDHVLCKIEELKSIIYAINKDIDNIIEHINKNEEAK
jgi:hypothetical protein